MAMEILTLPTHSHGVDYRESDHLTNLGGFLMTYGNQCRITMSARLSTEEKARGMEYLIGHLDEMTSGKPGVYLWLASPEQSERSSEV